ncbi:Flp family type IVb pilin [Photobacterium leiognathi]|uniref:Flp family type IVb pilin n=1 Tax=Photobacterium leiognathi TaxID=553611 RepID=UPI002981C38E|nr:Flp family type IVb pilin [Photobacterium leiognathi]
MNAMRAFFAKFQKDERGVTAIEYGLIALAMAALITAVFSSNDGGFISKLKTGFENVGTNIESMQTTHTDQP